MCQLVWSNLYEDIEVNDDYRKSSSQIDGNKQKEVFIYVLVSS